MDRIIGLGFKCGGFNEYLVCSVGGLGLYF